MSAPFCMNCKHKTDVVMDINAWTVIAKPGCRKFRRLIPDKVNGGRSVPLSCQEAMTKFCGGGDWEPTFWGRIKSWLTGDQK